MNELKLHRDTLKAILLAITPKTDEDYITIIAGRERMVNPHNDSYKPKRRSWNEIDMDTREEIVTDILVRSGY